MRLITRYLLREFLGPLVACMVVFNTIFLVFDLFDHVSSFFVAKLPLVAVLRYYFGLICAYSQWFTPASLMLATLYTMWQLSRNSEIIAMRASGISFKRLAAPFLVVSVFVALGTAAVAEFVTPEASAWSLRLKENNFDLASSSRDMRYRYPYYNPYGRRMWLFDEINVATVDSVSHIRRRVTVTKELPGGLNEWSIKAEQADYLDGAWWFTKPRRTWYDSNGVALPSSEAPLGALTLVRMSEFDETPGDIVAEARDWEMGSVREMLRALERATVPEPEKWFDVHYRFASPWACVVITLFAVPAGLSTARQSVLRGVFLALAVFFGFYALTHFGMFLGKQGVLAPWLAAWAPNIICFSASIVLYRKLL